MLVHDLPAMSTRWPSKQVYLGIFEQQSFFYIKLFSLRYFYVNLCFLWICLKQVIEYPLRYEIFIGFKYLFYSRNINDWHLHFFDKKLIWNPSLIFRLLILWWHHLYRLLLYTRRWPLPCLIRLILDRLVLKLAFCLILWIFYKHKKIQKKNYFYLFICLIIKSGYIILHLIFYTPQVGSLGSDASLQAMQAQMAQQHAAYQLLLQQYQVCTFLWLNSYSHSTIVFLENLWCLFLYK